MKTLTLTLLFLAAFVAGCEKADNKPIDIHGTWKLVEALNEPGDLAGEYYLTFKANGSLESTVPVSWLHMVESYELVNVDQLYVSFLEPSSQSRIKLWYRVENDTLTLSPTCVAPCGIKLVRK